MENVLGIIRKVKRQVKGFILPSVTQFSKRQDPYLVLVSCLLSLRTKDKTTIEASKRLFKVASTAGEVAGLSLSKLRKLIYPVGFYRNKARVIKQISRKISEDLEGKVPSSLDSLLSLKGVGRKTANLVLGLAFKIPAICVDTHVHRISNRLGWVNTGNPEETEYALMDIVPKSRWIELNTLFVAFGQNICVAVSPFCSRCNVENFCKKIRVNKSR